MSEFAEMRSDMSESINENELVDVVPTTPTQAFIGHLRLSRSRWALALICGALCLGIVLEYVVPDTNIQIGIFIVNDFITQVVQLALYIIVPVLGTGLGLVWLLSIRNIPFRQSTLIATCLFILIIMLPIGATYLSLIPEDVFGFDILSQTDNILYSEIFSLPTTSVLPKVVAVVCGMALLIFIWRIRDHWMTTFIAGIATIIFPLLGGYWTGSTLALYNDISIAVLVGLIIANLFMLVQSIRLQRWWWVISLILLPVLSVGIIWNNEQAMIFIPAFFDPFVSDSARVLLFIWSRVLLVLTNTIWPVIVLLSPWLMRKRVSD